MTKVIVFDYGGVITPLGPVRLWINKNLNSNDEKILLFKEKTHKWDLGELGLKEVYETLSYVTGVAPDLIWSTFFEKSLLNNEIVDLIKKLKRHYKIILFSNHCGELLRRLLEKHQIRDLFDEVIISSEHKMRKPDTKFFELLVKKSGVNKDEIIFIDDHEKNIEAANAFGIKACQFTDYEQLIKDLKAEGVSTNP